MAIAYKASGTLAETETSGAALSPTCPATVDAGDILIAHVFHLNITTAPTEPADWDLLYGPANLGTGTAVGRAWLYGKIAVGDEDGDAISFGTAGGTSGRAARIRSFSGRVSGTLADCVPASQMSDIPSEASIPLPTVTTTKAGSLAVAFLVQDDNNAFAAASGESGGSWTEPIAEDVDTAIGAQGYVFGIQVCTPTADPGTVTGGTANAITDEGSSIGIEIRDSLPVVPPEEGSATGSIAWVGSATGTTQRRGASTGTVSWAGSSTGQRVPKGTPTGTVAWVGSATGIAPVVVMDGTGSGTVTWVGIATGAATRSGSASGTIAWSGTANGATGHTGASNGTITWAGVSTGVVDHEGASSGTVSWTGSAIGEAPVPGAQEGEGLGTVTWAGTATGFADHEGTAVGTITWNGSTTGRAYMEGQSVGQIAWSGLVTGRQPTQTFYDVAAGGRVKKRVSVGGGIRRRVEGGGRGYPTVVEGG